MCQSPFAQALLFISHPRTHSMSYLLDFRPYMDIQVKTRWGFHVNYVCSACVYVSGAQNQRLTSTIVQPQAVSQNIDTVPGASSPQDRNQAQNQRHPTEATATLSFQGKELIDLRGDSEILDPRFPPLQVLQMNLCVCAVCVYVSGLHEEPFITSPACMKTYMNILFQVRTR